MSGPVLIQGAMEVETDWLVSRLERPEAFPGEGSNFGGEISRGWT